MGSARNGVRSPQSSIRFAKQNTARSVAGGPEIGIRPGIDPDMMLWGEALFFFGVKPCVDSNRFRRSSAIGPEVHRVVHNRHRPGTMR